MVSTQKTDRMPLEAAIKKVFKRRERLQKVKFGAAKKEVFFRNKCQNSFPPTFGTISNYRTSFTTILFPSIATTLIFCFISIICPVDTTFTRSLPNLAIPDGRSGLRLMPSCPILTGGGGAGAACPPDRISTGSWGLVRINLLATGILGRYRPIK